MSLVSVYNMYLADVQLEGQRDRQLILILSKKLYLCNLHISCCYHPFLSSSFVLSIKSITLSVATSVSFFEFTTVELQYKFAYIYNLHLYY